MNRGNAGSRKRAPIVRISAVLALPVAAGLLFHFHKQTPAPLAPAPLAPVPVAAAVAPPMAQVAVHKHIAKPHSPLRDTAKERERVVQRLHEFGLKREFYASRGVAGKVAPLASQTELDVASKSFTYATVLTSDHSQRIVPYSKLSGDCPALSKLRGRAALKINGSGKVVDGVYLPDSATIPSSVIGCQVAKPADLAVNSEDSFVTIYVPGLRHVTR